MKVALITGAGTGIGAATAALLASRGYAVALNGRREEPLREVAASIEAAGGRAFVAVGDSASPRTPSASSPRRCRRSAASTWRCRTPASRARARC